MEKVVTAEYLRSVFNGKRVFLTGHTGFKGAWLLQVLHWLGANIKGYSLAPEKSNDLYNQVDGDTLCYSSVIADICDKQKLQTEIVRLQRSRSFAVGMICRLIHSWSMLRVLPMSWMLCVASFPHR